MLYVLNENNERVPLTHQLLMTLGGFSGPMTKPTEEEGEHDGAEAEET